MDPIILICGVVGGLLPSVFVAGLIVAYRALHQVWPSKLAFAGGLALAIPFLAASSFFGTLLLAS